MQLSKASFIRHLWYILIGSAPNGTWSISNESWSSGWSDDRGLALMSWLGSYGNSEEPDHDHARCLCFTVRWMS
uniref:Uncharacterized protein n=1 Tax=Kalanchoe fedtschenkoi TaxID=63787 RepID=A0A7N0U2Z5_KALFE